jgi:hypothetical protein
MKHIKTTREYHLAMAEIETFLSKGFDQLSGEDETKLKQLSERVAKYEIIHFPMPVVYNLSAM